MYSLLKSHFSTSFSEKKEKKKEKSLISSTFTYFHDFTKLVKQ